MVQRVLAVVPAVVQRVLAVVPAVLQRVLAVVPAALQQAHEVNAVPTERSEPTGQQMTTQKNSPWENNECFAHTSRRYVRTGARA